MLTDTASGEKQSRLGEKQSDAQEGSNTVQGRSNSLQHPAQSDTRVSETGESIMAPDWAIERACVEANNRSKYHPWTKHDYGSNGALTALADYIAAHEQPPVDPLLIEAREIAADVFDQDHGGAMTHSRMIREGKADESINVLTALTALKARSK
jgi:hypothetical protein